MIILWHQVFTIIAATIGHATNRNLSPRPSDWQVVENLAENHPYVVALLNRNNHYICTGTIISKQAVLTSGSCVKHDPWYIAVTMALIGEFFNRNSVHKVSFTKLHSDYVFEWNPSPNSSQIHSNIGIVFAAYPVLKFAVDNAKIGDYYASELREKLLTVIGYGRFTNSNVTALQTQSYRQSPCTHPKWYYCVCGYEYALDPSTYEEEFGEGAPVFFGREVVAITVAQCGRLLMPVTNKKYNIFTVIGPYTSWIDKTLLRSLEKPTRLTLANRAHFQKKICEKYIYAIFIISKICT